jgi:hypothetical protein
MLLKDPVLYTDKNLANQTKGKFPVIFIDVLAT